MSDKNCPPTDWIESICEVEVDENVILPHAGKLATKHVDKNGQNRVTGNKENLKKSQSYPCDFGAKVAESWAAARSDPAGSNVSAEIFTGESQNIGQLRLFLQWGPDDICWEDALLSDVEKYLQSG